MYGTDNKPLNEKQIHTLLNKVVYTSEQEGAGVGVLTTSHRNTWAQSHRRLAKREELLALSPLPFNLMLYQM